MMDLGNGEMKFIFVVYILSPCLNWTGKMFDACSACDRKE